MKHQSNKVSVKLSFEALGSQSCCSVGPLTVRTWACLWFAGVWVTDVLVRLVMVVLLQAS